MYCWYSKQVALGSLGKTFLYLGLKINCANFQSIMQQQREKACFLLIHFFPFFSCLLTTWSTAKIRNFFKYHKIAIEVIMFILKTFIRTPNKIFFPPFFPSFSSKKSFFWNIFKTIAHFFHFHVQDSKQNIRFFKV